MLYIALHNMTQCGFAGREQYDFIGHQHMGYNEYEFLE